MIYIEEPMRTSAFGMYDVGLGKSLNQLLLRHEPVLRDHFLKEHNMNIKQMIKDNPPSILNFDNIFTAPAFGYKDRADYYDTASSHHRIPKITIPTFFLNALDDPVVGSKAIDYEVFTQNSNVALGVTNHGGHLGCHESLFHLRSNWCTKMALKYF